MNSNFVTDSIQQVSHPVIAGATGTILASPDHTTQVIALVIQVISLISIIFGRRK